MQFLSVFLPQLPLLGQQFGIRRLYAFGSVLTHQFRPDSDVDLLVEFDETDSAPEEIGERYWKLLEALESLLGRPVDLQRNRPFQNPYFRNSLERTRRLIYEREGESLLV